MSGREKHQSTDQQTVEEGGIKRLLLGIMEGCNDVVIPPLSYFSPDTEKASISRKMLKMGEAAWIQSVLKERKRRDQMAEKFSLLQSIVPSLSHASNSKVPREKVIGDTVDYIKYLKKEAERLEGLVKLRWKEQNDDKHVLSKSSVEVKIFNGATFLAIQLPSRRGLMLNIAKVLEKNRVEVLEARFSVNDQRLLTFTATVKLGGDGGSSIDKIREELLTL